MRPSPHAPPGPDLLQRLSGSGRRLTVQRQRVYQVLLAHRDHPCAEDVYRRAKRRMPAISLATVYNALEALVECGLVRRVTVDPGARRFCPNMSEHSHFYCDGCGGIYDVPAARAGRGSGVLLPRGFRVWRTEVSIRGLCPRCAGRPGPAAKERRT